MHVVGMLLTTACVGRATPSRAYPTPDYCAGDTRFWSKEQRHTCCWIQGRGCLDDRGNAVEDFAYDRSYGHESDHEQPYGGDGRSRFQEHSRPAAESHFGDPTEHYGTPTEHYRPVAETHFQAPSPPAPLPPWGGAQVLGSGHGVYPGNDRGSKDPNANFGDWFDDADERKSKSFWPPGDHPDEFHDRHFSDPAQAQAGWGVAAPSLPAQETYDTGAIRIRAPHPANCKPRFIPPGSPLHSTDLNGVALPDACFGVAGQATGPHHVFVIGDWGGVHIPPKPADHRSPKFPQNQRRFVHGVDDCAQQRVAAQMKERAQWANPDYLLNVGDNFYWGGLNAKCGTPPYKAADSTGQWKWIYEEIYKGPGLDNKQWLGVLGNHDFGGYFFTSAWDQVIGYTWFNGATHRWLTPALYWSVKVHYPDFAVDYVFVDSNVIDAMEPTSDQEHNICSQKHNNPHATCGPQGPESIESCPGWFDNLWKEETKWLDRLLGASTTEWQIVVTHYPPNFGNQAAWLEMSAKHGIDLFVTGHVHRQEVHYRGDAFGDTAYIISGGGGGITSEGVPSMDGNDDQYGFMDLTLSRQHILIQAISHGGRVRSNTTVFPRARRSPLQPTRLV